MILIYSNVMIKWAKRRTFLHVLTFWEKTHGADRRHDKMYMLKTRLLKWRENNVFRSKKNQKIQNKKYNIFRNCNLFSYFFRVMVNISRDPLLGRYIYYYARQSNPGVFLLDNCRSVNVNQLLHLNCQSWRCTFLLKLFWGWFRRIYNNSWAFRCNGKERIEGKKIVKDTCPSCAAPITGAVTKDYVCKYCNNKIMNVIVKKWNT